MAPNEGCNVPNHQGYSQTGGDACAPAQRSVHGVQAYRAQQSSGLRSLWLSFKKNHWLSERGKVCQPCGNHGAFIPIPPPLNRSISPFLSWLGKGLWLNCRCKRQTEGSSVMECFYVYQTSGCREIVFPSLSSSSTHNQCPQHIPPLEPHSSHILCV